MRSESGPCRCIHAVEEGVSWRKAAWRSLKCHCTHLHTNTQPLDLKLTSTLFLCASFMAAVNLRDSSCKQHQGQPKLVLTFGGCSYAHECPALIV